MIICYSAVLRVVCSNLSTILEGLIVKILIVSKALVYQRKASGNKAAASDRVAQCVKIVLKLQEWLVQISSCS